MLSEYRLYAFRNSETHQTYIHVIHNRIALFIYRSGSLKSAMTVYRLKITKFFDDLRQMSSSGSAAMLTLHFTKASPL